MRRAFVASTFILALLTAASGCATGGDPARSETQRDIGVRMAKMNLWREAMFRFQRAVEIEPDSAKAHSNLAVALEANGEIDAAAKEYREALRLDRSNEHIQKNYSRFVEFTQKAKKRDPKAAPAPGASPAGPAVPASAVPPATEPPSPATDTAPVPPPAGGER